MKNGISLVLPIYNEEGCIEKEISRCIESLQKTNLSFEIIIINDCSTDNSLKIINSIIEQNNNKDIKLISNSKNLGSGYCRRIGTASSAYENIIWTDVDLTYPNDELNQLYEFFSKTKVDMTVGSRNEERGTYKILRIIVKNIIKKFAEFLSENKIPDLNSGYRIFKKEVAEKYVNLLPNGFSCVTTMTLSFIINNHQVNYLNIKYKERMGTSKFKIFSDTFKYIRQIAYLTTLFNPLKIYFSLFLIFFMTSIGVGIYGLLKNFAIPNIAVILFVSSVIFFAIGTLSESVNKILLKK
jgi:glycosyltransferase involved in cell wall biosynthesis